MSMKGLMNVEMLLLLNAILKIIIHVGDNYNLMFLAEINSCFWSDLKKKKKLFEGK